MEGAKAGGEKGIYVGRCVLRIGELLDARSFIVNEDVVSDSTSKASFVWE